MKTALCCRFIFCGQGRQLAEHHGTAQVVKVGRHRQRNAEFFGEEGLGGQFAHVYTHAHTLTVFEVAALLNLDGAGLRSHSPILSLHLSLTHLARAH